MADRVQCETAGQGAEPPKASVVVPCKGSPEALARLLLDLGEQVLDDPFETIVVDSWSDDEIRQTAVAGGARVVRRGKGNLPGEARNIGVQDAASQIIAFVDADCRVDPGWLKAAISGLA